MAKPEWGTKRICPNCGQKYYDLRRMPPTCPNCGTVYDPEALLRSRRTRPVPVEEVKKPPPPVDDEIDLAEDTVADEVDDDVAMDELEGDASQADGTDEEEDVLIEDASELGEDDMDEVVDVEDSDDDERT